MSGIDEQHYILPCPDCHEKKQFSWWVVRNEDDVIIGFLNYSKSAIERNGEFNLEVERNVFLEEAAMLTCKTCGCQYDIDTSLFHTCVNAVVHNRRRKR